jgi:hypothetical protein
MDSVTQRWGKEGHKKGLMWAAVLASLSLGFCAGLCLADSGVPSKSFFEDYINKKAETYSKYRTEGMEPYLSMTLENNRAFTCVTSAGREIDFQGYVESYKRTFDNWVYAGITPVGVAIQPVSEDEIQVTYTMRMQGKTRAGAAYDVLRENKYTWTRIKADDQQKLAELNPQNLEEYFKEGEDKWIVTKIVYGF